MPSVWEEKCQKCAQEKAKMILSLKIILFDISDIVGEYLPCDDCLTYSTLKSQNQKWLFRYVKTIPFPETLDALWGFYYEYSGFCDGEVETNISKLNETTFEIVKFIYDNIFIDWKNEPKLVKTIMNKAHKEMKKNTQGIRKQTVYHYIRDNVIGIMRVITMKRKYDIKKNRRTEPNAEDLLICMMDVFAFSHLNTGICEVWCPP